MPQCKKCKLKYQNQSEFDIHMAIHILASIRDQLILINEYTQQSIAAIKAAG